MKNLKKNVNMKCSVCGNDQFSTVDESIEDILSAPDDTKVKCSDCGRITTKKELIEENRYIIDANIEDFKKEIAKELQKDIKKMFK